MSEDSRPLLTIDLGAIAENFRRLTDRLSGAECAAAIKADCYGLGMTCVAPALWKAGCREFFVATLEEGVAAREVLPQAIIHVLFGPTERDRGLYFQHHLVPVLNSLDQIREWLSRPAPESQEPVTLHLDTGMSRLGLAPAEVDALGNDRQLSAGLNVRLLMSHLSCADESANGMNERQLAEFCSASRRLATLFPHSRRSFANSSGIFLGTDYHFDLVRPGAAIYGLNPTPGQANPMRPVVSLAAPVLQARQIDAGKCVGYGATHRATRPTRIATIGLGYADGLLRSLSNSGAVYLGGHRAPIVGRVSMDLITIDVGHVPEHWTRPGTMIEIMGQHQDADELGRSAGTIGYEILTSLGRRYQRRYVTGE